MTEQAAVQGGSLLARTQAFLSDWTGVLILSSMILTVALLDQWTKSVIVQNLRLFEIIEVIPNLFNITYVLNPGAAFGILGGIDSQWRQIVILGVTALALCVIVYFLLYDYQRDRVAQVALGSILGGALGNLIDRVTLGHVVDFLDFYVGSYHWPAFNVADSAICVGVVVLLLRRPMELSEQQKNKQ